MRSRSASSPIFAVATIAVALLACKNKDDPAPDPGTAPTAANTATVPTRPKIEMPLFDHNLSNVCNGMPEKRTKKYAKKPGEIHSLIVFSRTSESDDYTKSFSDKFDGWKSEQPADYQLVGCVTPKQVKKVKECKFDAKQPVRYLDLADVTYEFQVYEAQTGEKLGSKTVEVKAPTRCPMFHMFRGMRETDHPDFAPAFIEFAKPFVAPKA